MKIPIYQVDAFTAKLFGGNPAAVCPLDEWLPDDVMQDIGMENNLSETAFFVKKNECFELRWFTPAIEVDLCGHATLASGHVLFNHLGYSDDKIKFTSQSGELVVSRNGDMITLDFPAVMPKQIEMPDGLIPALGNRPIAVMGARDLFALFKSEDEILALTPNFHHMAHLDVFAVCVTAPGKDCDFVSRFFVPRAGINEDPVTGSAHTALIPYWSHRLAKKRLHARQLSKRRGELFCENLGERVLISGQAVTYMVGEIEV